MMSKASVAQEDQDQDEHSLDPLADIWVQRQLFPPKECYTKEEVDALKEVLDERTHELEHDIETQKEYLVSLESQVAEHLSQIEEARNEIAEFMNQVAEEEERKLKTLASFYENMQAEQASPLFGNINDNLAIQILDRMDARQAGALLALLPPSRAARITAEFPRLKIQAQEARDAAN